MVVGLVLLVMAACDGPIRADPEREVRNAIATALPDMKRYHLVTIENEAEIVATLKGAIGGPVEEPVHVRLPIVDTDNQLRLHQWTAYHVNLRELQPAPLLQREIDEFPPAELDVSGPSLTFQGFPNWDDETFSRIVEEWERNPPQIDETKYQASVLSIIGDRLQGTYYGQGDSEVASVLESLETLLEPHFGTVEAKRLARLTRRNYIVYSQADFQPEFHDHHEGHEEDPPGEEPREEPVEPRVTAGLEPQKHMLERPLRVVMVADPTIFDPDRPAGQRWLISNWHQRVEAAAAKQNWSLKYPNFFPNVPTFAWSFTPNNNRISVRTVIVGFRVLNTDLKQMLLPYPEARCSGNPSYIQRVTNLSPNHKNHHNEYWMWWTRQYGNSGCAWVAKLHKTPRNGAVGWVSFGNNTTVDWTSFVFTHETGHIIGGTHVTNDATSPETLASHRCRLVNGHETGPTGPSLMSYATGTRTRCFAASDHTQFWPHKRNLTKVAEYLHHHLKP
jgi:hypothetical protein